MKRNPAVGLDIGTSKVCAVVADAAGGGLRVLGSGSAPAAGLRKGMVVHMDDAAQSIRQAVKEAAASAGIRIGSASVGISGGHLQVMESSGAVGIRGRQITGADRDRVVDVAGTVYIPLDREVLHTLPAEFMIDGIGGIRDPIGMAGVRLETKVHIVTASAPAVRNLALCCEAAGVVAEEFIAQAAASGRAVLTEQERDDGVVLIDVGGGTTDIALFRGGRLRHVSVLCVGGNHITNDVAIGLGLPPSEAERLKRTAGAAFLAKDDADYEIEACGDEGRRIPRSSLVAIMQARCEEVIEMIMTELHRAPGSAPAACGVVLTGGASRLPGLLRLMASRTGMPVRMGRAAVLGGRALCDGPEYAAAVGLVHDRVREDRRVSAPGAARDFVERAKDRFMRMTKFNELLQSYKKEGGNACLRSRR